MQAYALTTETNDVISRALDVGLPDAVVAKEVALADCDDEARQLLVSMIDAILDEKGG